MAYKREKSRKDRMHNIAIAIIEIQKGGDEGTRTRTLREHIRRNLVMDVLTGEARNGDLRAHGDALGAHGLHLDVVRQTVQGKPERVIFFTEENITKCQEFLDKEEECRIF